MLKKKKNCSQAMFSIYCDIDQNEVFEIKKSQPYYDRAKLCVAIHS